MCNVAECLQYIISSTLFRKVVFLWSWCTTSSEQKRVSGYISKCSSQWCNMTMLFYGAYEVMWLLNGQSNTMVSHALLLDVQIHPKRDFLLWPFHTENCDNVFFPEDTLYAWVFFGLDSLLKWYTENILEQYKCCYFWIIFPYLFMFTMVELNIW